MYMCELAVIFANYLTQFTCKVDHKWNQTTLSNTKLYHRIPPTCITSMSCLPSLLFRCTKQNLFSKPQFFGLILDMIRNVYNLKPTFVFISRSICSQFKYCSKALVHPSMKSFLVIIGPHSLDQNVKLGQVEVDSNIFQTDCLDSRKSSLVIIAQFLVYLHSFDPFPQYTIVPY